MFGPGRGEWDVDWMGWWGSEPPYHAPVFVLTHHLREQVEVDGGTTFTFVPIPSAQASKSSMPSVRPATSCSM
jgi:hypothetical protein